MPGQPLHIRLKGMESLEQRVLLTVSFLPTSSPGFFVADINQNDAVGSNPGNLIALGESVLFSIDDGTSNVEIWKSDGNDVSKITTIPAPTGLINRIDDQPQTARNVSLREFVTYEDTAYFMQRFEYVPWIDTHFAFGLWKTDGTEAGTDRISQIAFSTDHDNVEGIERVSWVDAGADVEVKVDDLSGGSSHVIDELGDPIYLPSGTRVLLSETELIESGQLFLVNIDDQPRRTELRFSSDGSLVGTTLAEFSFDDSGAIVSFIANLGEDVLFTVRGHSFRDGTELWISNGTEGGTRQLHDLPLPQHSIVTASDNQVVMFSQNHRGSGDMDHELVIIDLENNSKTSLDSFGDQVLSITPILHDGNQTLFATHATVGIGPGMSREESSLWRLDNVSLVVEELEHLEGRIHLAPESVDGVFYFTGEDQLWKTDGTAAGTQAIADAPESAGPLAVIGSDIYFSANRDGFGQELWKYEVDFASKLAGDIDANGSVDFADFLILAAHFGENTSKGTNVGDLDEDGVVSFKDFLVLSANFGKQRQQ